MYLEEHVTSEELSRKLKELGVPQLSFFYWNGLEDLPASSLTFVLDEYIRDRKLSSSAFLSSELGEMLPKELDGYSWRTLKTPTKGAWEIKYRKLEAGRRHPVILHQLSDPSEANVRARMLIWLIQARLVDPKTLSI